MTERTFTYKVAEGCTIKADTHQQTGDGQNPTIVFIHGGCLMMGSRRGSPTLIGMLTRAGYTVVSIDYRLAPETKIDGIIDDLRDAFVWVRGEGPKLFGVDAGRIGVMGDSAGGYLTLMSGFVVNPPPRALVSFYGYGDIDGPWYSEPDPFYRRQGLISEATARDGRNPGDLRNSGSAQSRVILSVLSSEWTLAQRSHGARPQSRALALRPSCPVRNVTARYPPTMLLHGDSDTDVPYEQSVRMAKRLDEAGVNHRLITMRGMGHGFDDVGFADPVVSEALNQTMAFLREHV